MAEQVSPLNIPHTAKVASVPFGVPFARTFAENLLKTYQTNSLALADVTIWVPSRRAALALEEAFLSLRPAGLVLPHIKPMHLTDEDAELLAFEVASALGEPASPVSEHGRLLYLAQQVLVWQRATGGDSAPSIPHAYDSAASLASLSDRLRTHGISPAALSDAVPPDMADHWEMNLQFLKIVFEHYPTWLREQYQKQGADDPADLRKRLLLAQAQAYRENAYRENTNPEKTNQAANYLVGFTDTTPAGLELMRAVLATDNSQLVLQGFDPHLAGQTLPPTHPHYSLNRLIKALDIPPEAVDCPQRPTPQGQLLMHAQAPSGATDIWLEQVLPAECAENLTLVQAQNPRQEADTIAAVMRETLETPERTCALVTTDRQLATRVADRLRHWDITVNDSAGTPLPGTTAGSFFLLLSEVVATGFKPQVVARLLAHPLATGGLTRKDWKEATRTFEAEILRGVTPGFGLVGLRQKVMDVVRALKEKYGEKEGRKEVGGNSKKIDRIEQTLERLDQLTTPLRQKRLQLAQWVRAHVQAGRDLARNDQGENSDIFLQQEDGDVLFQQLEALMGADSPEPMSLPDYHNWLQAFLSQATVRAVYTQHPRLFIWGPLEARLQQTDRVIIGGMNEGTWPNLPRPDPWLNRAMAADLGLPPKEMAIGLNAHDFCALASAPDTFLTRAAQQGGAATVPSRYLLRLKAVLQNNNAALEAAEKRGDKWLNLARQWSVSTGQAPDRLEEAKVTVPTSEYPQKWSASAVSTFMQCPYRFYGEKVLKLQPFEPFDQAPDAADKGELIHKCFEAFMVQKDGLPAPWQTPLTRDNLAQAKAHLMTIAEEVFKALSNNASRKVWLSRFDVAAGAFVETLFRQQRAGRTPCYLEQKGEGRVGNLRFHARADRVDKTPYGYVIMDYKTGHIPSKKNLASGLAPQLPLEGLIMAQGGFGNQKAEVGTEVPPQDAGLEYCKVGHGDAPFNNAIALKQDELEKIMDAATAGLHALEETFLEKQTPLHALPEKDACRLCDFAGVCRRHEWQGDAEEGGEA